MRSPGWLITAGFAGPLWAMAILKIARMGHPVLSRPAEPVADPTAPEIKGLDRRHVGDPPWTWAGPGSRPLRSMSPSGRHFPCPGRAGGAGGSAAGAADRPDQPRHRALGWGDEDGLGSLPFGARTAGQVPRSMRILYRGVTPEGVPIEREAEGFHARLVQHECDHLDGILYPMRMTDLSKLMFAEEMRRYHGEEEIED